VEVVQRTEEQGDGGVPTMTGRQPGGAQPNVKRVAATFRRCQRHSDAGSSATGSGDPAAGGRMARLMAVPRGGLADNSTVHSRSSDG